MAKIGELYKTADWKSEKHVPVIECPDEVAADEIFNITLSVGKEISHPNTTEHHIRWIQLVFHPEGEKFPYEVAKVEFCAHGESVDGANKGSVYTHHAAAISMKSKKSGVLYATSLCNIHGLWEGAKQLKIK